MKRIVILSENQAIKIPNNQDFPPQYCVFDYRRNKTIYFVAKTKRTYPDGDIDMFYEEIR